MRSKVWPFPLRGAASVEAPTDDVAIEDQRAIDELERKAKRKKKRKSTDDNTDTGASSPAHRAD